MVAELPGSGPVSERERESEFSVLIVEEPATGSAASARPAPRSQRGTFGEETLWEMEAPKDFWIPWKVFAGAPKNIP